MSAQIREVDTVARYGGEEFVVVLPETDAAGTARAAERLVEAIRAMPFEIEPDVSLHVTASVGAAVFPVHGRTPNDLLRCVDSALYEAKNQGRDRWRFAHDVLPGSSTDGAVLVTDLHAAVDPRVVVMPDVRAPRDAGVGLPLHPEV